MDMKNENEQDQAYNQLGLEEDISNLYQTDLKPIRRFDLLKLESFMRQSRSGLQRISCDEEAVATLAVSLHSQDPFHITMAARLLGVICIYSPEGHDNALKGITTCGEVKGQDRFAPIMQGLSLEDIDVKISCIELINALLCKTHSLDCRIHLRNEMLRTGVTSLLKGLGTVKNQELQFHLSIFKEVKDVDERDFGNNHGKLNFNDPRECFELLHKSSNHSSIEPHFLSILQLMLSIPNKEESRIKYYRDISSCISKIVLQGQRVEEIDIGNIHYIHADEVNECDETLIENGDGNDEPEGDINTVLKSKLEKALTAKYEAEAKVAMLEEKNIQYQAEIKMLKLKIKEHMKEVVSASISGRKDSSANSVQGIHTDMTNERKELTSPIQHASSSSQDDVDGGDEENLLEKLLKALVTGSAFTTRR